MAVTKQTYTATATWTASQLAEIFRQAFIDAGLMTEWHDSFLSGNVENRVLRIVYDAGKTYGTTFYWFMFSSVTGRIGVSMNVATGWNTTTKQPTGTQYLDFLSTTTNSTSNHWAIANVLSSTNTVSLIRYTSGIDTSQSWFVVKFSTSKFTFTIHPATFTFQNWIDLNKGFFSGLVYTNLTTINTMGFAQFIGGPKLRREIVMGCGLVGSTTTNDYINASTSQPLIGYRAIGHLSNNVSNFNTASFGIPLPIGFSATNPAYTSNSSPVFHSVIYSPYIVQTLPSDFGISFHYATNTFSVEDTFVVNVGTEEWEVLDYSSNSSSITGASPLFLARVV